MIDDYVEVLCDNYLVDFFHFYTLRTIIMTASMAM